MPGDATARTQDAVFLHSRQVLVIEDHRDTAEALAAVLVSAGHSVLIARDGRSGVKAARAFLPEVVVCDIHLPDIDGFQVAREFKCDDQLSRCYFIAVTGFELNLTQSVLAFNESFMKPIHARDLLEAVDRAA